MTHSTPSLLERLKHSVGDALSGQLGPRAQVWAWRVAALHPGARVLRCIRAGQIHAPLAALTRRTHGLPGAARLHDRLADMAAFCNQPLAIPAAGQDMALTPPEAHPVSSHHVLFALHSCGAFDASGYGSRSVALIHALQRQGVVPTIATRPGYPWDLAHHRTRPRVDAIEHQGLLFHLVPDPESDLRDPESRYIEQYSQHLQVMAMEQPVSVIHAASNYLNGTAAAIASRRLGLRSIYEVRGLWHLTRAYLEPGYADSDHYRYCEQREVAACHQVDHVITLSPALRQWLMDRGIASERISIVGNAAAPAPDFASVDGKAARSVRSRWAIPMQARVLGYLGSLVAYEGIDALIQSLARTPQPARPYLLIVGSGQHSDALQRLAKTLGVESRVVFTGQVAPDQVAAHFAAMDAVVLPRRADPLTRLVPAIKPFEVLAHRRPLFISLPLAQALGNTLAGGYEVLDIDTVNSLDTLFEHTVAQPVTIPTWDDRATEVAAVYQHLLTTRAR